MAAVVADPSLYAFTGGKALDAAALRGRFERLVVGRSPDGSEVWHNWVVRLAATGEAVGTIQATVKPARATAEMGWVVGVPWQGQGYASEAAVALVDWLAAAGLTTIEANIHPRHAASEKVATRAGLTPTDALVDGERVWRRGG